jgi:hypothetical protein
MTIEVVADAGVRSVVGMLLVCRRGRMVLVRTDGLLSTSRCGAGGLCRVRRNLPHLVVSDRLAQDVANAIS